MQVDVASFVKGILDTKSFFYPLCFCRYTYIYNNGKYLNNLKVMQNLEMTFSKVDFIKGGAKNLTESYVQIIKK